MAIPAHFPTSMLVAARPRATEAFAGLMNEQTDPTNQFSYLTTDPDLRPNDRDRRLVPGYEEPILQQHSWTNPTRFADNWSDLFGIPPETTSLLPFSLPLSYVRSHEIDRMSSQNSRQVFKGGVHVDIAEMDSGPGIAPTSLHCCLDGKPQAIVVMDVCEAQATSPADVSMLQETCTSSQQSCAQAASRFTTEFVYHMHATDLRPPHDAASELSRSTLDTNALSDAKSRLIAFTSTVPPFVATSRAASLLPPVLASSRRAGTQISTTHSTLIQDSAMQETERARRAQARNGTPLDTIDLAMSLPERVKTRARGRTPAVLAADVPEPSPALSCQSQSQLTQPEDYATVPKKRRSNALQSRTRPAKQARIERSQGGAMPTSRKAAPKSDGLVLGKYEARIMAGIRHYAEPGEDLDWTVVESRAVRQKMQRTIATRKRQEGHRREKGLLGTGGNYLGAEGVRAFMADLDETRDETVNTRTYDAPVTQCVDNVAAEGQVQDPILNLSNLDTAGAESVARQSTTNDLRASQQQSALGTSSGIVGSWSEENVEAVVEGFGSADLPSNFAVPDDKLRKPSANCSTSDLQTQEDVASSPANMLVASDLDVPDSRRRKLIILPLPAGLRSGAQKANVDSACRSSEITALNIFRHHDGEEAMQTATAVDIQNSHGAEVHDQSSKERLQINARESDDSDSESILRMKLEDIDLRRDELRLRLANHRPKAERAPVHDAAGDRAFVNFLKPLLKVQSESKSKTWMKWTCGRVLGLLERAQPPDENEALFLSGINALKQIESGQRFDGPIFTEGQQPSELHTLVEFLAEHYDDDAEVFVQVPSVPIKNKSWCQAKKMSEVKERFSQPAGLYPWNLLELASHVEDGVRPKFLNHEDCRLLSKIKFPGKTTTARHAYSPGWKEVEKWVLVAEAGAVTGPHQDSHGFNTYITVQQGVIGFGWLANPTQEERAAWVTDTDTFTGGRWRYVMLKPGQTVAFPSGTVHFVFRSPSGSNTLAFGGHYLRCSQIVRWAQTLLEEQANTNVTNEDLTVSAPEYLKKVERFVRGAAQQGKEDLWGGRDAIAQFLELKEWFFVKNRDRHARAQARKPTTA